MTENMTSQIGAEDPLDEVHKDTVQNFLPVMLVMGCVCLLGIVGNAFTIGFYGFMARRTPTVFMITALAVVDLIVTVLIVPNIVEMAVNVKYTNAAACKIMHFFGHWTIETSTLLLGFIAFDRCRHVCWPFKSQVTFVIAKRAVTIITVLSCLLSIRDFVNFDIIDFKINTKEKNDSDVLGHYCTTRDDADYKISVTFFHSIDVLTILLVLGTLIFAYGKIILTIRKDGFVYTTGKKTTEHKDSSPSEEATRNTSDGQVSDIRKKEDISVISSHVDMSPVDQDGKQMKPKDTHVTKPALSKIKNTERSITLTMLAVSIVFCLCFIPYFVVKIGIRSYKNASQLELGPGIQVAVRFTYVNSFANPIIYCIFNPQLRRFIRGIVTSKKAGSRSR